MAWRNERSLYHRPCSKTGKQILSVYPADTPFPVYERKEWLQDDWDPLRYGRDYDFSRPFFDQFADLLAVVPRAALNGQNTENADYCNFAFDSRTCYMCQCVYVCESLLYAYWLLNCRDCVDCSYCFECELCYDCTDCNHSYHCRSCILSHNCTDSFFLYDCRGCTNCFGCVGLRKKSYCLFNQQLTKEDYEARMAQIDLENPEHREAAMKKLVELKRNHPHLYSVQEKTEQCTGDYIFESKTCVDCFQMYRCEDCQWVQDTDGVQDALDCYHPGWSELIYESYSLVSQQSSAFCIQCWEGHGNFYCDTCQHTEHCFGCISLQQSKFCILNKQYTEEEYGLLLPKIVKHMQSTGEYGEFFPITLSPFAYNETLAHEQHRPLSKEQVLAHGWKWKEETETSTGKETIRLHDSSLSITEVSDAITKEILACERCRKNYRIIPQELAFYRTHMIPLPRLCPDCRYTDRLMTRNPRHLWQRTCADCQKPIQTSYAPDRPERVVCEECYLKEIY